MISPHRKEKLEELEQKLGIKFHSENLLNQALTHRSYPCEVPDENIQDNERLEFFGDAVLKLAISQYLFNKYPSRPEGDLTKIRSTIVSDVTLAEVSKKLNLGEYILLSSNEKSSGGDSRTSNLANTFEALLAAIYIDQGIGKTIDFIVENLLADIEKVSQVGFIIDYKSALQEMVQKRKMGLPCYKVIKETGPKHNRVFSVEVKIKGKKYGKGEGLSKKSAEQAAACQGMEEFKEKPANKSTFKSVKSLLGNFKKK